MKKVVELCPFCEEEVKLKPIKFQAQKCPNCGKLIKACSLCNCDECNCAECEKLFKEDK